MCQHLELCGIGQFGVFIHVVLYASHNLSPRVILQNLGLSIQKPTVSNNSMYVYPRWIA